MSTQKEMTVIKIIRECKLLLAYFSDDWCITLHKGDIGFTQKDIDDCKDYFDALKAENEKLDETNTFLNSECSRLTAENKKLKTKLEIAKGALVDIQTNSDCQRAEYFTWKSLDEIDDIEKE